MNTGMSGTVSTRITALSQSANTTRAITTRGTTATEVIAGSTLVKYSSRSSSPRVARAAEEPTRGVPETSTSASCARRRCLVSSAALVATTEVAHAEPARSSAAAAAQPSTPDHPGSPAAMAEIPRAMHSASMTSDSAFAPLSAPTRYTKRRGSRARDDLISYFPTAATTTCLVGMCVSLMRLRKTQYVQAW